MLVVPVDSNLYARSNQALSINPPNGTTIHITSHGSDIYWAGFAVFSLTFILLIFLSYLRKRVDRFFYYTSTCSLFFLSISYYTMASDLGFTGIQAEFNHVTTVPALITPGIRQIFYARYIGWFLAFPTLLINLAVLAGVTWPITLFIIICQEIFVVALLIGALITSSYKWGYFVFAAVALLIVVFNLIYTMPKVATETAEVTNNNFHMPVLIFALFFSLLLILYPICWGLSEGGNVIQPDSEAVFYFVLDFLLFVVWTVAFMAYVAKIDLDSLGIYTTSRPMFHNEKYWEEHQHVTSDTQNGLGRPSDATAVPATTTYGASTNQYSSHTESTSQQGQGPMTNDPNYAPPMAPAQQTV